MELKTGRYIQLITADGITSELRPAPNDEFRPAILRPVDARLSYATSDFKENIDVNPCRRYVFVETRLVEILVYEEDTK
jgi:hypothetical protein